MRGVGTAPFAVARDDAVCQMYLCLYACTCLYLYACPSGVIADAGMDPACL